MVNKLSLNLTDVILRKKFEDLGKFFCYIKKVVEGLFLLQSNVT